MEKQQATRLRFTYEDDLVLLREFLNANPIVNPHGWEEIQTNILITMGKKFLIKTLKQHLQLLIEIFSKKIKVDDVKSGIEEPYYQKNALLYEVSSLVKEYNYDFKQKKKTVSTEQRSAALGKQSREDCAQTSQNEQEAEIAHKNFTDTPMLTDHDYFFIGDINEEIVVEENKENHAENHASVILTPGLLSCNTPASSKMNCNIPMGDSKKILGPRRSRVKRGVPLKQDALSYLTDRNTQENRRKLKELELEERRVSVEEQKIILRQKELELKEKEIDLHHKKEVMAKLEIEKKRADVEVAEKKLSNQLMQSQQKLIDQLLQRH